MHWGSLRGSPFYIKGIAIASRVLMDRLEAITYFVFRLMNEKPRIRANGAKDISPGQRPGDPSQLPSPP